MPIGKNSILIDKKLNIDVKLNLETYQLEFLHYSMN